MRTHGLMRVCLLFAFLGCPGARAQSSPAWQERALADLCARYLGSAPDAGAAPGVDAPRLDRLLRAVGRRLELEGTAAVPAEDLAMIEFSDYFDGNRFANYRMQLTPQISLTPDFQLILGSGGRIRRGTHTVYGFRLNFGY